MTTSSYFRYPHLFADRITFVAEDDVWVAPLSGGRAWRVSAESSPPRNPRFTPDGSRLVWTVTRGTAPEVVSAPADGGTLAQLTHWGHASTKVKGFTPDGGVVVTSAFEQADSRLTWAYAVDLASGDRKELPWGPVDSVAYGPQLGDERPMVISTVLSREPAAWKRYRGGTGGKLWIDTDGSGDFVPLVPELDGNLCDPLWVGDRIAFLSDHEGHGNLYSVRPDGTQLRRHTDFEGFYVRHASTDGTRIVFESAGNLFLLPSLDAEAEQLRFTLGSTAGARAPHPLAVGNHLGEVTPTRDGRASVLETHGTLHWLTHKDGPSRVVAATPGVRARLGRALDDRHVYYIADDGGTEALYIRAMFEPGSAAPNPGATSVAPAMPAAQGSAGSDGTGLPRPVAAHEVNAATFPAAETAGPGGPDAARAANPAGDDGHDGDGHDGETPAVAEPGETLRRIEFPGTIRAAQTAASPDGAVIAVSTEYGEIFLVDVADGTVKLLTSTDAGAIDELVFSPDSAWLLWSEPMDADERHSRLRMASLASGPDGPRILELTDGRFADYGADFTPDGKFIAFLSRRSFDPVYDMHSFDLSFPVATKPYLLALAASTPSPFGPDADGATQMVPVDEDAAPAVVVVDEAGLSDRIIAVPVAQGRYSGLKAVDGGLLWKVAAGAGEIGDGLATAGEKTPSSLDRFDLATAKTTRVVSALGDFRVSGDRQWILTVHDGAIKVLPAGIKSVDAATDSIDVDLARTMVTLEPLKVWGQAFDEAWRLQRDFFYTPDMAGTNWQEVHDRYRPIVERLGSHDDLVDLLWELHGELGTSHAYVTPAATTQDGAGAQGRLGATFRRGPDGYEITGILAGDSSDPQAYSPLAAPGVAALPGDVVEAVNGQSVTLHGLDALLAGTAGKVIELTLAGKGAAPTRRRVAVVPLASEERLRYQEWVRNNRAIVRQASQGAFGYLHIPDMQARGWAELHRDLDAETSAEALIVDVRRNRGGHTSQLVAEVIGRRMDAWSLARGQRPGIYPSQAPRGPVVVVCDEFAGSDGDIITAVVKLRGIGPVVGVRTWGGVVGIDSRFSLADGTGVTQPRYAYWFRGGQGFHVENYGVDPNIVVPFPPHDHAAGNDPQLEAAIGVLVEMQREIPTVKPPELTGYRKVAPAPLPPRPKE